VPRQTRQQRDAYRGATRIRLACMYDSLTRCVRSKIQHIISIIKGGHAYDRILWTCLMGDKPCSEEPTGLDLRHSPPELRPLLRRE
jgi:hypothetical protein